MSVHLSVCLSYRSTAAAAGLLLSALRQEISIDSRRRRSQQQRRRSTALSSKCGQLDLFCSSFSQMCRILQAWSNWQFSRNLCSVHDPICTLQKSLDATPVQNVVRDCVMFRTSLRVCRVDDSLLGGGVLYTAACNRPVGGTSSAVMTNM